jgi:hypothetical protein
MRASDWRRLLGRRPCRHHIAASEPTLHAAMARSGDRLGIQEQDPGARRRLAHSADGPRVLARTRHARKLSADEDTLES